MKVVAVGAGPSGLYSALLLRKALPDADIDVYEARPADRTFGWGVVFSDATLTALRDADGTTFEAITDSFVRWTAIDIRYRDRLLRSDGHTFAGLARTRLLALLQQRCAELGVRLHFDHPITDLDAVTAGADLVLGSDGVRSTVREAHAGAFGASIDERHARYIWFGTDLLLDAFTFLFRQSPHGLFQVHAYPYDGTHATFIVETAEATWRRAGLDQADEAASIAFCEDLFAEDLRGARLRSNDSRWLRFATLRTRGWSHGNAVLLGDAAHTAHFSIGSGTKLAMEDAIALARAVALEVVGTTVPPEGMAAALRRYEAERKPVVERFQDAAQDSLEYFEDIARYTDLDPEQFAFLLLTRSGRITYDRLRVRDPRFVAAVDAHFAATAPQRRVVAPPALQPLALGEVRLANRVAVAPVVASAAVDGLPGDDLGAELAAAAGSGAALVLAPTAAVSADGRVSVEDTGLYDDAHAGGWRAAIAKARAADDTAVVGLRLGHAGPRGATRPRREGVDMPLGRGGWPLLAASAVPYLLGGAVPRALDGAGMAGVVAAFAAAAARAGQTGAGLLIVDAADGCLLASFCSPLTNQRDDAYGGDLAARLAFPLDVVAAVRAAWPEALPLGVRLTADDRAPGGTTPADAVAAARAFASAGCDLVEVRAGQTVPGGSPRYEPGHLLGLADRIRNEAGVPVLVGGGLHDLDDVNTALAAGRADLCISAEAQRIR